MKVNGKEIVGIGFAYDGCHKFYIIANEKEKKEVEFYRYEVYPLKKKKMEWLWKISCPMRYIERWDLTEEYVRFGEDAIFED